MTKHAEQSQTLPAGPTVRYTAPWPRPHHRPPLLPLLRPQGRACCSSGPPEHQHEVVGGHLPNLQGLLQQGMSGGCFASLGDNHTTRRCCLLELEPSQPLFIFINHCRVSLHKPSFPAGLRGVLPPRRFLPCKHPCSYQWPQRCRGWPPQRGVSVQDRTRHSPDVQRPCRPPLPHPRHTHQARLRRPFLHVLHVSIAPRGVARLQAEQKVQHVVPSTPACASSDRLCVLTPLLRQHHNKHVCPEPPYIHDHVRLLNRIQLMLRKFKF